MLGKLKMITIDCVVRIDDGMKCHVDKCIRKTKCCVDEVKGEHSLVYAGVRTFFDFREALPRNPAD